MGPTTTNPTSPSLGSGILGGPSALARPSYLSLPPQPAQAAKPDYILVNELPDVPAGAIFKYQASGKGGPGYYYSMSKGLFGDIAFYTEAVVQKSPFFFQKRISKDDLQFKDLPLEVQAQINIYEHRVVTNYREGVATPKAA